MIRMAYVLSGAFLVGILAVAPTAARGRPTATVNVKAGYIDSHFAVSPNGKYLAYLHVVNNRSAHLMVMMLSARGLKRKARIPVHPYTVMPLKVQFTPDSRKIILLWRAKPAALSGDNTGVILSLTGQRLGTIPAFEDFRLRKSGKTWKAIIYKAQKKRGSIWHLVTVYSFPAMRRTTQYRLITDKVFRVAKPKMELVYFIDDYMKALAKVPGRYDKKRDIRLPDREAIYDMATRKILSQRDIKEAVRWERIKRFRQKHNPFDPVVVLEGAPGRPKLQFVSTSNRRTNMKLNVQLARFHSDSLRQQFLPGGRAMISLTVDPQNPITLKQRRSEPEVFHLFTFTTKNASRPRPVKTLKSDKQVIFWRYGKSFLAVMRLHENWTLGRNQLEVYKVSAR